MNTRLPLVMLGAGGHAKVLLSLAQVAGWEVRGVCDPELAKQGVAEWRGIPVLGDDDALDQMDRAKMGLINGIGQLVRSRARQRFYDYLNARDFHFPTLIHPSAWVDSTANLANGVQVMAGAIIQADVFIGPNCIINTRASVDHECTLGGHIHIAPGATLCGGVQVENGAFVGCGANIIQGLHIGEDAVVGAGVTLARSLPARKILLGPASREKVGP